MSARLSPPVKEELNTPTPVSAIILPRREILLGNGPDG